MPPNSAFVGDKTTYGDIQQRDVYMRHKIQTSTNEDLQNYSYQSNGTAQVTTLVERVNVASNASGWHLFVKTASADIVGTDLSTAQVSITDADAWFRSANVHIPGNAVITGGMSMTGNLSANNASFSGGLGVGGNASITGTTTLTGDLSGSNASMTGNSSVGGNLAVTGTTTLTGNLSGSNASLSGNASIGGNAAVTGTTTLTGDLTASANASVGSNLAVTGTTTLTGNLSGSNQTLSGNLSVGGNTNITGTTTLTGNLSGSNANLSGNLAVTGTTALTGDVTASGNASITGNATVTGTSTLTGDVTASSNLSVTGTTTLTGNLSGSNASLSGNLAVTGNTAITGNLSGSNANLSGNLVVSGSITATGGITQAGNLDMGNYSILNLTSIVNPNVKITANDATASVVTAVMSGNALANILTVDADGITVAGNLNVLGQQTQTIIESNVIQVGDKNIQLGIFGANLAQVDGAGLTIGDTTALGSTAPTLTWNDIDGGYWASNYDIRGVGTTQYAAVSKDGVFIAANSTSASSANVTIDSTALTFGSTAGRWRFALSGDTLVLQHFESSAYVNKFVFSA